MPPTLQCLSSGPLRPRDPPPTGSRTIFFFILRLYNIHEIIFTSDGEDDREKSRKKSQRTSSSSCTWSSSWTAPDDNRPWSFLGLALDDMRMVLNWTPMTFPTSSSSSPGVAASCSTKTFSPVSGSTSYTRWMCVRFPYSVSSYLEYCEWATPTCMDRACRNQRAACEPDCGFLFDI